MSSIDCLIPRKRARDDGQRFGKLASAKANEQVTYRHFNSSSHARQLAHRNSMSSSLATCDLVTHCL